MVEKPRNTYGLGPYLQLMYQHLPGVAKTKTGFVLDFFDLILDADKLEEYESAHEDKPQMGKTAIQGGVWKGINKTDLLKFYWGKRKPPAWKAVGLKAHLDQSLMEDLLAGLSVDALMAVNEHLAGFGVTVETVNELPITLFKWLQAILAANAQNKDLLADNMSLAAQLDIFEGLDLAKGRIAGGQLKLGKSQIPWPDAPTPPHIPDIDVEGRYIRQLCLAFGSFDQVEYVHDTDLPEIHRQEYQEQRGYFWDAQGLSRNLRDVLENEDVFDQLKDDLYDGVIDTCRDDYPNGLKRMRATLTSSTRTQLTASVITQFPSVVQNRHRKGMCHMLTNEGRMMWVEES